MTVKQPRRLRLLGFKKFKKISLLCLMTVAAVTYMYESENQLEDFDPIRFLTIGNNDKPVGGAFPENIIPPEDRRNDDEIRYASFGSSVTWGSGLVLNREKLTYVARLANDPERGINFGIRSTGPNYPAACLYSMMGDQEFDVIVLEFYMRAHEGLLTLGVRLRERFPNAIIIITRLWAPSHFTHKETRMNLSAWAEQKGFGQGFIHNPRFRQAFLEDGEDNWSYVYGNPDETINQYQKKTAEKIGAHIVKMNFDDKADGPNGWIARGDKYLAADSFHLSKGGHAVLAQQIRDIVDRLGVPKERTLGQFLGTDYCNSWFESGVIDKGVEYSPNGRLYMMPHTDKYVLSFGDNDDNDTIGEGGWVKVSNPSDKIMELFIAYMTTGPTPSKYPKVEVTRKYDDKMKFILDPNTIGWKDKQVHVVRLAQIGTINPGAKHIISFRPLEKTEYPFRLVSIAITPVNENSNEQFLRLSGPKLAIS